MSYRSKIFKSHKRKRESSSDSLISQWKLPKTAQKRPIGELKGQLYDCYRILQVDNEEIIEVRHVKYNGETILVYHPTGVLIGDETIYTCKVIWKKNGQKIGSKEIFVGEIDFEMIKKNRFYFTVLMGELLSKPRIERRSKNEEATYVGRVKKINDNYMKYLEMDVIDGCSKSKTLGKKQEQLDKLIEIYNTEIKTR